MKITSDINDQLMIMAAHRYCLGRMTYMVSTCVDFLDKHWDQLDKPTQDIILRDTKEAIENNRAGWECDKEQWQRLLDNKK